MLLEKNFSQRRASSPSSSCTMAHSHCTACARASEIQLHAAESQGLLQGRDVRGRGS